MNHKSLNKDVELDSRKILKELILKWNTNYPIDFIWRRRNGISFNSPQHRSACLIDIKFELEEESVLREAIEEREQKLKEIKDYKNSGVFLKEQILSQEELDDWFDTLDFSAYNKSKK